MQKMIARAALAQSVERRLGKAEVGGSIPLGSLNNYNKRIPQKWLKIAVSVVFFYIFIDFISK